MSDPTRPASGYPSQPTNGYPQPPPQQQQQPPNSTYYYPNPNQNYFYHARPPQPPRATFFRCFFTAFIVAVMILAIILLLFDIILRPRVPILTVSSLSLSSLNLSTTPSQISATWTSTWTISNPNGKLHVYYDEIESRILYRSSLLAVNQLPPFDQTTKSQSNVTATVVATSAYISPELNRELDRDRSKGSVEFDLQVLALVRFKSSGWRSKRRGLRAFCDGIPVVVSVKGNFSGGSRRCAVVI